MTSIQLLNQLNSAWFGTHPLPLNILGTNTVILPLSGGESLIFILQTPPAAAELTRVYLVDGTIAELMYC